MGRESFDLVIVSQGSPAFEGRAVLERAIEKDPYTRVLVITRSVHMDSYSEEMQLEAHDYVEKPTAPAEIAKSIWLPAALRADRVWIRLVSVSKKRELASPSPRNQNWLRQCKDA